MAIPKAVARSAPPAAQTAGSGSDAHQERSFGHGTGGWASVAKRLFLALSSSDHFSFPFRLSPRTVAATLLGVALTLLVAQQPALRALARQNLAEAAKMRN